MTIGSLWNTTTQICTTMALSAKPYVPEICYDFASLVPATAGTVLVITPFLCGNKCPTTAKMASAALGSFLFIATYAWGSSAANLQAEIWKS